MMLLFFFLMEGCKIWVQNMEFNTYVYDGPVLIFGKCVANRWKSKTIASSESKARSNLADQLKKQAKRVTGARVE